MIWLKLSCNLMIQVSISSPFVIRLSRANFSPKNCSPKIPLTIVYHLAFERKQR